MRIAFVGKGGSGKTTLAALLARTLAAEGRTVLAIDADINQHLAEALGISSEQARAMPKLGEHLTFIKDELRGENPRVPTADQMIKTTPPGTGSQLMRLSGPSAIFDKFQAVHDGVRLMSVGEFTEEDLGVKCYHSKTGSVELILNHLVDGPDEVVIVDMTAGSDAFASGLFRAFDMTALVVEPTIRSTDVYGQYARYADAFSVPVSVVANQVADDADLAFIRSRTGVEPIAVFHTSGYIRALDRGIRSSLQDLESENATALTRLVSSLYGRTRDWDAAERAIHEMHRKNADAWGNATVGRDLTTQIDPEYHLAAAVSGS